MLVGIIPNPYRTEERHAEQKKKYTDEILCYGRRKTADRGKDETPADTAVWGLFA